MSTTLVILGVFGIVCLVACVGFGLLLLIGYWQHIREGRKEHRAFPEEKGE